MAEDYPEKPGQGGSDLERDGEDVAVKGRGPLEYDENDPNLVFAFSDNEEGRDALRKIRARICERFNAAWDASTDYRKQVAEDWKMIESAIERRAKGEDIRPHLPIMLLNIVRLAFRTESEIFGDWSKPISYAPVGETPIDQELAEARTYHTCWQFRDQIPDFRRQIARGLMAFYALGEAIGYSSFDEFCKVNRHEVLTPDAFVMPYVYESMKPDLSDAPWYARVMHLYAHELETHRGDWYGVDRILARKRADWDDEPEGELRKAIELREGHDSDAADDVPHKILHYEGWESDLPGQDRPRWIRAYVDELTQAVLKLTIHEEERPEDLELYQERVSQLNQYMVARDQHQVAVQRALSIAQNANQLAAQGISPDDQTMAQAQPPAPPPPPDWMDHPQPGEQEADWLQRNEPAAPVKYPIYMFSRVVNIEDLAGNHGIGHGRMQAHYNLNANRSIHQFIDAAKAGNVPSYLAMEGVKINDGDEVIDYSPGRINKVTGGPPSATLDQLIQKIQSQPGNPQLVELANMMDNMAEKSAQSPDVLSGEPGKSGETFRGLSNRIEQATTQLKVPAQRFGSFVQQLAKNNGRLNSIFMRDQEMIHVLDPRSGKYQHIKIGRDAYAMGAYDVALTSDLRFISKRERVAEADEIVGMSIQGPLATNPHFQWHALRGALEARGRYDMVARMGAEPPLPPTPFGQVLPPSPPPGTVPGPGNGPPPGPPPQGG